jgi:hypothetical protein
MGSTWNRSDGIHSRKEAKGRGEPTVRPRRASCCTLHRRHRKPTRDRQGLAQVGRTPLLHPAFPVPADNAGSNRPLWREHGRSPGRWGRRSRRSSPEAPAVARDLATAARLHPTGRGRCSACLAAVRSVPSDATAAEPHSSRSGADRVALRAEETRHRARTGAAPQIQPDHARALRKDMEPAFPK